MSVKSTPAHYARNINNTGIEILLGIFWSNFPDRVDRIVTR